MCPTHNDTHCLCHICARCIFYSFIRLMEKKGRYGQFIRSLFTTVDFLILNLTYVVLYLLNGNTPDDDFFSRQVWFMMNISFAAECLIFSNIHSRRVVFADRVVLTATKAVMLFAILFFAFLLFLNLDNIHVLTFVKFFLIFFPSLSCWWLLSRRMLKIYRSKGGNYKRIIIIGGDIVGMRLLDEMLENNEYGYRIMGLFDDNQSTHANAYYKGKFDDIDQFIKDNFIDEMYCTLPDGKEGLVQKMIRIADSNAVDFYYVPQFGRTIKRNFDLQSIGNVPILAIRPNPLSNPINRIIKRIFDFVFSSCALIVSPLILIPVAIGIKLTSPGPIFFKQKRTGYRGKEFVCYKFRTMKVNNLSDSLQASKNDPRKTRFGDFLRRSSIDELPQFFNVWRGDMSTVGPRPHMLKHTKDYSALIDKYMVRHTIKPGITGWAQVNGYRGETRELWQMEKRVEYDVWYAENWNFMLDLKIIYLTVWNAIRGEKNAF